MEAREALRRMATRVDAAAYRGGPAPLRAEPGWVDRLPFRVHDRRVAIHTDRYFVGADVEVDHDDRALLTGAIRSLNVGCYADRATARLRIVALADHVRDAVDDWLRSIVELVLVPYHAVQRIGRVELDLEMPPASGADEWPQAAWLVCAAGPRAGETIPLRAYRTPMGDFALVRAAIGVCVEGTTTVNGRVRTAAVLIDKDRILVDGIEHVVMMTQ